MAAFLAVFVSVQAAYSQELSQAWKNWREIKTSAHFQKTASPKNLQNADASSFIPRLDAFLGDLNKRHAEIFKELKDGKAQCFNPSPEVSSEKGLECLNLQNQFVQDYGKYVRRLRALKLLTIAMFGSGDGREAGVYRSLDLTQALQVRDRLASSLFLSVLPSTKELPRQFYIPNGVGSEGMGTGDADKISVLSKQEKKDSAFIITRYLLAVCGGDFRPSHETLASFQETAASSGVSQDSAESFNGLAAKMCGLFQ